MTFTRIAARFATKQAAEEAQRWAERYAVKVPLAIHRHDCAKPALAEVESNARQR